MSLTHFHPYIKVLTNPSTLMPNNSTELFTPAGRRAMCELLQPLDVTVCGDDFLDTDLDVPITDEGAVDIIKRRLDERAALLDKAEIALGLSIGAYTFRGTGHPSFLETTASAAELLGELRTAREAAHRELDPQVEESFAAVHEFSD
ncbi:MAG: hypothetical protein NT077_03935 [Candidatus Taylorbacteria bacterium]|nr:hypothetical protein [Candidatus Taylorbacteria bacterium]